MRNFIALDPGLWTSEKGKRMIRTGDEYRESLCDGREVYMNGEKIADVTTHPAFKPIVDIRARIYDLAHDARDSGRHVLCRSAYG